MKIVEIDEKGKSKPGEEERGLLAAGSSSSGSSVNLGSLLEYLATTPAPLAKAWWHYVILGFGALGCTIMYVTPSIRVGTEHPETGGPVLQVMGNTSMAALVVPNIGTYYFNLLDASLDAKRFEIQYHLSTPEERQNCFNAAIQWLRKLQLDVPILSLCVACPYLAVALYSKYKDWADEPDAVVHAKAAVTYLVNAITHTLPISLLLNVPWLNFLLVKVVGGFAYWPVRGVMEARNCCLGPQVIETERLRQVKLDEQTNLQMHLSRLFSGLAERVKRQGFSGKGCCFKPKKLEKMPNDAHTLLDWLEKLLGTYPETMDKTSLRKAYCYCVREGLGQIVGGVGAIVVGGSVSGYLKVNYDVFNKMFGGNTALTIALMVFPILTTEVLTGYFGYYGFKGAYDFIRHPKMPYSFKLNPILSAVFLTTTYFLNCFAYGTALQLVEDGFPESTFGITHKVFDAITIVGLLVYGFINMAQLLEKLVEPTAKRFGSQEQKDILETITFLRRAADIVKSMKPAELEKLLKNTPEQNLKALGFDKLATGEVVVLQKETTTQIVPAARPCCCSYIASCCSGLFHSKAKIVVQHEPGMAAGERDPLLARNSGSVNGNGHNVPVPSLTTS
ncbi:MAG: hypothetical protein WCW01_02975 [Gammaproteobacteria bacterium]